MQQEANNFSLLNYIQSMGQDVEQGVDVAAALEKDIEVCVVLWIPTWCLNDSHLTIVQKVCFHEYILSRSSGSIAIHDVPCIAAGRVESDQGPVKSDQSNICRMRCVQCCV